MFSDAFATSFIAQLTPELLAASLLVLASLCFFTGTLVLLLVIQPRLRTKGAAAPNATTPPPLGPPPPEETRRGSGRGRRQRIARQHPAPTPRPEESAAGRDFSREILLAQQGSDAHALMQDCGLTHLEANLVVKLYGQRGQPSASAAVG